MSEGLWSEREVDLLLNGDVLDGAFECLRRIWQTPSALEGKNIGIHEHKTRKLEFELARQYPSLYGELVDRLGNHPLKSIDDGCGIILDALSLREGFKLEDDLQDEFDWDISLEWSATETVPTDTEFIADAWFGANGGKQASQKHSNVTYIGEPEVPPLSGETPEFVWSRFPDERLHNAQQGKYTLTEIDKIYEETKELLIEIVRESIHDEFIVSSDHGYVNFSGNLDPYKPSDEVEEILKDKFGNKRYHEVTNSGLLRRLEERDITMRSNGYFMIKGHYAATTRSASSKITHGGLSLVETMTPVLRINTGGA